MNEVNKSEALLQSPLTAELDGAEVRALADQMGVTTLRDGEVLVAEGGRRQTLFVQAAGAIQLYRDVGGKEEIIYQTQIGGCIGIRTFIDGSAYMFGLRAIGDSAVLTLEPAALEALDAGYPRLPYKVMRALVLIAHGNMARVYLEGAELRNYLLKTGGRY